jgi:hypothetical protein
VSKETDQATKAIAKGHQKIADEGDSGKTRAEIAAAEAQLKPGHRKGNDD